MRLDRADLNLGHFMICDGLRGSIAARAIERRVCADNSNADNSKRRVSLRLDNSNKRGRPLFSE